MNRNTLLHRQVHPNFIKTNGDVTSQAFFPTPKDGNRLSVYDGDMINAARSWAHYTGTLGLTSAGVVAVSVAECLGLELVVSSDPSEYPEHALIEFGELSRRQATTKSKQLSRYANARDWQFRPQDTP